MSRPLEGIRVLEVASWMFIPSGGAVLVDWGAEVLKVEHPETGDPQRGLMTSGIMPGGVAMINFMIEQPNRGKKSIAIDISHPDGHEALMKLVETADVFLTNYLPPIRRKLKIDTDDIRARNPNIIIARGSGQGPLGPDAEKGGFDGAAFWARGAVGITMPPQHDGWPGSQPTPAFGDVIGGMTTAGGIAAALVKRERTGEPSIVDVSLLGTAMWQISPMILMNKLFGIDRIAGTERTPQGNPGVGTFKTKDGRFVAMMLLQGDRFWADWVTRLGKPELVDDPRFDNAMARAENAAECQKLLDEAYANFTLDELRIAFDGFEGVWSPFQTLAELYDDPQVVANGYLPTADINGTDFQMVASPAQFDETAVTVVRAPEHGEHTETELVELGYDWDQIIAMKESGAIL
ncbi:MAG: CoA transferase [Acidimicrobiales bacterium]|nr:CoA transferase [Acidimicrobiales bacterium]